MRGNELMVLPERDVVTLDGADAQSSVFIEELKPGVLVRYYALDFRIEDGKRHAQLIAEAHTKGRE